MTYVEKSQMKDSAVETPVQGSLYGAATRVFLAIFERPLRGWRNSRDLRDISQLSTEQLRDIGLTPSDVVAARCAPFHVGASIMLADMAERRRLSVEPADDNKVVQPEARQRQTA